MTHLVRAGLVLGLAIASFLVLRSLILQGRLSFPEFALRPPLQESNVRQWASRPLKFSNSRACAGSLCHQDIYDVWLTSDHGGVACETCHGPALAHGQDTNISVRTDHEECTLCHAKVIGRRLDFPQVDPAGHYSETTCTSCHKAHRPGPPSIISHEVSEGSDCLSCHGAASPPDRAVPADHVGRTNEQCLSCHEAAR